MLGHAPPLDDVELELEEDPEERIARLSRRVAWQVEAAYAVPAEPGPAAPAKREVLPTLPQLERVVGAAEAAHPERLDEWRWYLRYLSGFAAPDGSLDDTFGLLIERAFGSLLAASADAEVRVD